MELLQPHYSFTMVTDIRKIKFLGKKKEDPAFDCIVPVYLLLLDIPLQSHSALS